MLLFVTKSKFFKKCTPQDVATELPEVSPRCNSEQIPARTRELTENVFYKIFAAK